MNVVVNNEKTSIGTLLKMCPLCCLVHIASIPENIRRECSTIGLERKPTGISINLLSSVHCLNSKGTT